jgi:serine/threonine-protein kinase ATR
MDREIALLVQESARLAATDGVDKEEAEKPLLSAVELLRQAESAAGFPELQAPENYLLCAEAALGVDNVSLAHSCLESFLHARPAKNQFLVRAYFALGKVQAAYCDGLKSTELLEGTMAALAQVQHGLQLAAELGAAHRFLVYNGSVHLWNVARPLMALPTTAAALVPVLEATIKALEVAQEADSSWRLQLSMALARCMEAAGKRKEAGAMLGTCGGLAKERRETEQLLQLQLHMLAEDAGAAKKLRDDNASKPRLKGLLTAQALRDAAAPPPTAAEEIIDAMGAVDKEFAAVLRAEGGAPAVQAAMLELRGSCDEADVLLALATQAVECGLLDLADHAANRCAMATELGARVRAGYVREAVRVKRLDDGSNGPPQGEVYTRLMVGTRVDGLKRLEEGLASARRTGDAELVTDGCVLAWNIAMPLLQPSLYHHAVGILSASASALEEIGAPTHEPTLALTLALALAMALPLTLALALPLTVTVTVTVTLTMSMTVSVSVTVSVTVTVTMTVTLTRLAQARAARDAPPRDRSRRGRGRVLQEGGAARRGGAQARRAPRRARRAAARRAAAADAHEARAQDRHLPRRGDARGEGHAPPRAGAAHRATARRIAPHAAAAAAAAPDTPTTRAHPHACTCTRTRTPPLPPPSPPLTRFRPRPRCKTPSSRGWHSASSRRCRR